MTAPAELEHPFWCVRDRCADRGWHAGRLLVAVQAGVDPVEPVSCRLVQLSVPHAEPYVTLVAGRGGGAAGPEIVISTMQARILKRFLGRLVEMAGRAER